MNCASLHPDDPGRLTKAQLIKLLVAVTGKLAEAESLILAQSQRIEELMRNAGKNRRDSGMSPSSDDLSKPTVEEVSEKRARSLRGKSNRASGGRPGYPGRTLRMVETPDEVVEHYLGVRERCDARLPKAPFPEDVAGPGRCGKRIEACVAYPAVSSSSRWRGSPISWRICSARGSRKPRFRR